jgi:hypothetical protein
VIREIHDTENRTESCGGVCRRTPHAEHREWARRIETHANRVAGSEGQRGLRSWHAVALQTDVRDRHHARHASIGHGIVSYGEAPCTIADGGDDTIDQHERTAERRTHDRVANLAGEDRNVLPSSGHRWKHARPSATDSRRRVPSWSVRPVARITTQHWDAHLPRRHEPPAIRQLIERHAPSRGLHFGGPVGNDKSPLNGLERGRPHIGPDDAVEERLARRIDGRESQSNASHHKAFVTHEPKAVRGGKHGV